jgi:predicted nuclease of predicted toxin-antitoxin system
VRFFLDHDVNDAVAHALRRHGHDAFLLREVLPVNAIDSLVFSTAQSSGFIVITCNRDDYLQLANAQRQHHGLIILIRRSAHTECINILRLIDRAGQSGLAGNINFA